MSVAKYPELFPIALGNEEESMLQMGADPQHMRDPVGFVSRFGDFIPKGIKSIEGPRKYLQNGGLIYDGGAFVNEPVGAVSFEQNVNLERATPECSTPRELATCIQASESMYLDMLKSYLASRAKSGSNDMARVQRRTVDSYGNGRGCHDSFEARRPQWMEDFDHKGSVKSVLSTFLATRSFMTGVGYVAPDGVYFAQKVQHLKAINKYGYTNSAYRNASEDDTGARLEIRCNDINISPWATQVRVGGAALLFTLLQTPLVKELNNIVPGGMTDTTHIANFRRFNAVEFNEEGQMRFSPNIVRSLDFQERALELMEDSLGEFIDIPPDYQELLYEMRYYCEDFRKVLHGEKPMALLADRSDVAAKFNRMIELNQKARDYGLARKIGDVASMAVDLRYDNITIDTQTDGRPRVKYGYGYKHRQQGKFRMSLLDREVERAMYHPPQTTRAKSRGELIRSGKVEDCEWSWFKHEDIDQKIRLTDVLTRPEDPAVTGKS